MIYAKIMLAHARLQVHNFNEFSEIDKFVSIFKNEKYDQIFSQNLPRHFS